MCGVAIVYIHSLIGFLLQGFFHLYCKVDDPSCVCVSKNWLIHAWHGTLGRSYRVSHVVGGIKKHYKSFHFIRHCTVYCSGLAARQSANIYPIIPVPSRNVFANHGAFVIIRLI